MTDAAAKILSGLNDAQREAVVHSGSPLLVVAGAGSGKTRVVTCRIAHLMASGVEPYRILAITFTNKAAGEMRERIEGLVGPSDAWISTFHSMCARALRREIHRLGYDRSYSIYDRDDTLRCIREATAEVGLSPTRWRPESLCAAISSYKNACEGPDEVPSGDYRSRNIAEVYRVYQDICRRNNAVDFDDLLVLMVRLLEDEPEVRQYWQGRFRHVLIDEYQDTNRAQYRIVRALASGGAELSAVGDPDQSIYAWRGADVRNILEFQKDFPGTKIVRLEENYRSTEVILSAASGLIRQNTERIDRELWSKRASDVKVTTLVRADEELEAAEVASTIERLRNEDNLNYQDFAIFYRTNAQSRPFEDVFVLKSIPYALLGSISFYERKEIKDAIAYLRLLANPADDLAFRRAVNTPTRGIGDKTVMALRERAAAKGVALAEALLDGEVRSSFGSRAKRALDGFASILTELRKVASTSLSVAEIIRETLRISGYVASLDEFNDVGRAENLDQLVAKAAAFDEKEPESGLADFLAEVSLVADVDEWDEKADRVALMTLHSAKGLEFGVVFVTGMEEGLLPHARSIESGEPAEIEEERRLAYVGMTRAKDRLFLTRCRRRYLRGVSQLAAASRFISELPEEALERGDEDEVEFGADPFAAETEAGPAYERPEPGSEEPGGVRRVYDEDADLIMPHEIEPGDRVNHRKFGLGVVVEMQGSGLSGKVIVDFTSVGPKKLVLEYARLTRL